MGRFALRRLGFLFLTLLLTSIIIFSVTQFLPGDVARILLPRDASEEAIAAKREDLGLNRSALVQYGSWIKGFIVGDWGTSFAWDIPVRPRVIEGLINSLMLAAVALVLAIPLSIGLGVWAGLAEGRWPDHLISLISLSLVGLPEFVTGVLLIEWLAQRLRWLPAISSIEPGSSFVEALPFLILPALTATFVLLAYLVRLTRAEVIEQLNRPYVRTAVLKGLSWPTVVFRHVLRNALLPTITVLAISMGWLIGGLIVIENVFNYPGLGRLLLSAIDHRDFPLIQAIAMIIVLGVVLANFAADLLYALLNPRIRYD
ncbi:ABC transporter permease [Candidatus Bipolaricaulota bacterium]|jgi:peptide/nickel transport system permease protein|nr:ABC transporter permease [Candidatus Bipolaricaulota bacterium]TFH10653.1 MAG: ABC transporter permease [Candidatus Atribacteria bacterium]